LTGYWFPGVRASGASREIGARSTPGAEIPLLGLCLGFQYSVIEYSPERAWVKKDAGGKGRGRDDVIAFSRAGERWTILAARLAWGTTGYVGEGTGAMQLYGAREIVERTGTVRVNRDYIRKRF
jgi:CTP synthase (UTP-ammonia lyase)